MKLCETCSIKDTCGYKKNGKESDCIDVQNYDFGYEQAVEKAKKAYCSQCATRFKEKCKVHNWCVGFNNFVKEMEEQE